MNAEASTMHDSTTFDVIVIGGGPGGCSCALRLAKLGQKVALIDDGCLAAASQDTFGGTCLHVGCIPSKALLNLTVEYEKLAKGKINGVPLLEMEHDLADLSDYTQGKIDQLSQGYAHLLKRHNVATFVGSASFLTSTKIRVGNDSMVELNATNVVIATGAVPSKVASIKVDGERILDSTSFLAMNILPKSALVVGAGAIGLEAASIWARLGVSVTLIEALQRPLPYLDNDVYARVKKTLLPLFDEVITGKIVTSTKVSTDGVGVTISNATDEADSQEAFFDAVLVAVGRSPNTQGLNLDGIGLQLTEKGFIKVDNNCKTDIDNLWAIGDVAVIEDSKLTEVEQYFTLSPMLAHRATADAMCVADLIVGNKKKVDRTTIASVIYTEPEIAWVGCNENTAKLLYPNDVGCSKANFAASGRCVTSNTNDGVLKLIYRKSDGVILGCQVYGHLAGELLQTVITAMEFNATIGDLSDIVYSHPGYSEIIQEAAGQPLQKSIHS